MRIRLVLAMVAILAFAVVAPAAASSHEGTVTVVHGVPGLTVDVYVNGDLTLEDFEPGTITDPLTLPADDYEIEVYPAGADPEAEEPAISGTASLPGGANASIAAHLTEGGEPTLSVFVNDVSEIAAGESRLTVRHTAAAPAVDVRANEDVVFAGLANSEEDAAELPAGAVSADVVLAGESDPVLGPVDLTLEEGTGYFAYAIGSAEDGTLDLLVQTSADLHTAPNGVEAGTGGMAAAAFGLPLWAMAAMGLAAALAVGSGTRLVRVRA